MTPQQIITIRALAFASDSRLDDMVTMAGEQTGTVFGDQRNTAIALLVMHWLALEQISSSGQSGMIISEKEGDLSRSYGFTSNVKIGDADLGQTRWGIELLRMRKSNIFGPRDRTMDTNAST